MKRFFNYIYSFLFADPYARQREQAEKYLSKSVDLMDLERREKELQRKGLLI